MTPELRVGEARPPSPGVRVGTVPGVTLTKWRRIWSERFPGVSLDVVGVAQRDQRAALDTGRVDMCFIRLPMADDELHVIPLYKEVAVVVVSKDHPAAAFDAVMLADLSDETVLADPDADDAVDLVADGAGVLLLPQSIARSLSRRDLVYRPVSDAAPTGIALAWRRDNSNRLIEEFIGIVRGRTVNSSRSPRNETPKRPPKTQAAQPQPRVRLRGKPRRTR